MRKPPAAIDVLRDGWSRPAVVRALVAPDRRRTCWETWRRLIARLRASWAVSRPVWRGGR